LRLLTQTDDDDQADYWLSAKESPEYNVHNINSEESHKYKENQKTVAYEELLHTITTESHDPEVVTRVRDLLRDKLPNDCLIKASYRTGFIETQDDDDIYVSKALFDTGALHANYISKRV
jgi:hypothetical protein